MKLLIVEDNVPLAKSLNNFLSSSWTVHMVSRGEEAIDKAKSSHYDVIVLDLGLPDMDGQEVCRAMRKAKISTPILVLSGMSETDTKVNLFKCGADDYVTKPFDVSELNERLLALLRRGRLDTEEPYLLKLDSLTLDPIRRQVQRSGQPIKLRRKEFDILEYLLRNTGRVVSRAMIMDNVWEEDSDPWNNTVDVHIKYLRDKVDRPFKNQLIKTAHGVGYTISDSV